MTIISLARRLARDQRGNFTIEFALALPLLLVLLLTGIEFTRYVLVNQKVERTSASLADLVAQTTVMTEDGMDNLFQAAKYTMDPFDVAAEGRLIVTSIAASGGPARIRWQRAYGANSNNSAFGVQGAVATLPAGLRRARRRQCDPVRGLLPLRADDLSGHHRREHGAPVRRLPSPLRLARDDLPVAGRDPRRAGNLPALGGIVRLTRYRDPSSSDCPQSMRYNACERRRAMFAPRPPAVYRDGRSDLCTGRR